MRLVSSWACLATNTEVAAMFGIGDAAVRRHNQIVLGEGRKMECVESFCEQLTKEQREGIEAVGTDRSGVYQAALERWLSNADIVDGRCHLVINVNQAVDEVRRSQCRRAGKDDRQLLKGQRYLLLGNHEKLDADGRGKLDPLLETNQAINTAYIFREQFRWLFRYRRLGGQGALRQTGANWRMLADLPLPAPCEKF